MDTLRIFISSPGDVAEEREHALSLGRDNFIRPVYRESPLPQADSLPPEPLARIHFQFLGGEGGSVRGKASTSRSGAFVSNSFETASATC